MELKVLSPYLKYVFLQGNNAKPVVISNSSSPKEEIKLADLLKKHKKAIGWHISNLKEMVLW